MVTNDEQQVSQENPFSAESTPRTVVQPFARLIAVITDPQAAMRGVAIRGAWWVPLLVVIAAFVVFYLVAGDVVSDYAAEQTRERLNEMVVEGRLTQEQADQFAARQAGGTITKIMIMVNPLIASFLIKLIFAALFLLGGNVIFGGNARFGQYWALLWYAAVIGSIGTVISSILIAYNGDIHGAQLGLGILTSGDPTSTAHKILAVFNVFSIWEAIVAGIGLSVLARISQPKGIGWALVIYLGFGLLTSLLSGQSWV